MDKQIFYTPILFIIFNRPKVTQVVFDRIREIKPKYLFIAADGPRHNVLSDIQNCKKARSIIEQVDWDCQIKTFFRSKNMGCGRGVSEAISWFFEHVEQGIILEDDCLPDKTFFEFTQLMLEKYKNQDKVKMIAGTNYFFNRAKSRNSYYFSQYFSVWGWATWKRAWKNFDFKISSWPKIKEGDKLRKKFWFSKNKLNKFWSLCFDSVYNNKIDPWDYQWFYSCLLNDGLSVVPINNLVSNLGNFGTHGAGDNTFTSMPIKPIDIKKIIHPRKIEQNIELDKITYKNIGITKFNFKKRLGRVKFAVYRLLKKVFFIQK